MLMMVSLSLELESYISWLWKWSKGYRLWCTYSKSHGFVTSKNVTFEENPMLHLRKEFVVDTTSSVDESSNQGELESKALERAHNRIRVM